MFMFKNARCGRCEKVFCCSKHRKEHQLACEPFKSKRVVACIRNPYIPLTSKAHDPFNSLLLTRTNREKEDLSSRKTKRKHDNLGSPFPRPSGSSLNNFLIPSNRQFKKAVRGKFRKIQKVPTLEPVKEEDEEDAEQSDSVPQAGKPVLINGLSDAKPTTCDAYNDFVVGSLNDSPISIVPLVLLKKDKDILVTPTTSSGMCSKLNGIFKTSTPDVDSPPLNGFADQPGRDPLLKLILSCKTPHLVNLEASTPKESERSCAGKASDCLVEEDGPIEASDQECDAGITPVTKVQPVQYYTPVDAQASKRQSFIRPRSSSGSSGSSQYYSASSMISPLALNSHPCTPVTNPSLFTSVNDVFRAFVSRLPGSERNAQVDGFANLDSPTVDPPARKRMKTLAESRIKCRPTYKGRYKKRASYDFNRQ